MACVRQTDAWCRPGGNPVALEGLVRRGGSEGSGSGRGRTGVQSGKGENTQDLKTRDRDKIGFEEGRRGTKEELMMQDNTDSTRVGRGRDDLLIHTDGKATES